MHVAAHGQHQPSSPLFSSLRMTDGDVYAHELPAGAIRAGHVVLSACDVGTAQVRPGDEPLGLAHTLLATGVTSVVAAVAPVPDDETAAVMAAYHQRLAAGLPQRRGPRRGRRRARPSSSLGSSWAGAHPLPRGGLRQSYAVLHGTPQRRTLVYSVRLSPQESNAIQKIADARHLPGVHPRPRVDPRPS